MFPKPLCFGGGDGRMQKLELLSVGYRGERSGLSIELCNFFSKFGQRHALVTEHDPKLCSVGFRCWIDFEFFDASLIASNSDFSAKSSLRLRNAGRAAVRQGTRCSRPPDRHGWTPWTRCG